MPALFEDDGGDAGTGRAVPGGGKDGRSCACQRRQVLEPTQPMTKSCERFEVKLSWIVRESHTTGYVVRGQVRRRIARRGTGGEG